MPTYGVLGKYGSGKSNFGTAKVIRSLIEDDKPIVTTLALNVAALNEYVQTLTERDCRTFQRVFILSQEQMKKFWRYRGVKCMGEYGPEPVVLGNCSQNDPKSGAYDAAWNSITDGGVHFHIDEAPRGFHSRLWGETGIECTDYIDQHRRCGDDVWLYARSSSKLDKQLRLALDSCVTLDNWYQRVKGMFRAPRKIVARYYEECPPDRGDEPYKKEDMHIDPEGISGCYWTERGVGVTGTVADKGKMASGLHWSWSIVFVIAACIGTYFFAHYLMKGALHVAMGRTPSSVLKPAGVVATNLGVYTGPPKNFSAVQYGFSQEVGVARAVAPAAVAVAPAAVAVVPVGRAYGYAHTSKGWTVDTDFGLVDGSKFSISNRFVVLDGLFYERAGPRAQPETPRVGMASGGGGVLTRGR